MPRLEGISITSDKKVVFIPSYLAISSVPEMTFHIGLISLKFRARNSNLG